MVVIAALGWLFSEDEELEPRRPASRAVMPDAETRLEPDRTLSVMRRQDLPEPARSSPPSLLVYVIGDAVNLRAGPSTDYGVIGQAHRGDVGEELGRNGEWVRLRLERNGTEGWMFGRYVAREPPSAVSVARQAPATEQQGIAQPPAPTVSEDAIRQALVDASIARYPGSCPCPYHVDRGGRRCGGRSG